MCYYSLYRGINKVFKVAIVEDSAEERQLISDYLARYGRDFKVFAFSSAVDFLTGYQPQYDIVFMDIDMPYLDGMSAARPPNFTSSLRRATTQFYLLFEASNKTILPPL